MSRFVYDDLNSTQKDAILYNDGPLLVIAGAGTGKTRVITYKIAYLLKEMGIPPENILAVTFTNKAADEMLKRVVHLVGKSGKGIWIGTFHSVALRMLRRDGHLLGLPSNFSVIDQDDRIAVIREILKLFNIDPKKYPPKMYLSLISNYKNTLEFVDEVPISFEEYKFNEIFRTYQDTLKKMAVVDFDDMLSLVVRLLKRNPDIKYFYRQLFRYLLVDEFQDTNAIQMEFLTNLVDKDGFITAVGDDDQSIYGWRGAEIKNILNFENYFPNARIIKLVDNYRSGFSILDTANRLICNNKYRKGKDLKPYKNIKGDVFVHRFENEMEEASFVSNKISELLRNNVPPDEIAILYRANAQSRNFEVELNKKGIPFKVMGSVGFYGRKEIKDILSYLRLFSNPYDIQSFKRAVKIPHRGIGDATIDKISQFAINNGVDIWTAIKEFSDGLTAKAKKSLDDFLNIFNNFEYLSVSEMIRRIVEEVDYETFLSQYEDQFEVEKRMENVNELVNAAAQQEEQGELTLSDFLATTTLQTSIDEDTSGFVKLMTIHSAKGLEFDTVFLTGLEEGVFPLYRAMENEWEMEEERRLCYVGITRSKERLYITHVDRRLFYGKAQFLKPSPFIDEIKSVFSRDHTYGRVYHERFGEGKVFKIEGSGDNARVTVNFDKYGYKTIIAKFLKFY
ncbi:ATP-dependent helicase [Calditerrivibrio nitroreducens]|uniref:DNA 3'-5' helicase n=1 Tax=Calditerrivibrio nitroreducens (strain DSM 19672 / NBRC 101217 / Yu37-1) TaxID=768670 RepID=E4TI82_CALNY|nr:UvrD-helicase domain-containing protein [Calditerrivibrio nitroreducens]ADR18998.1 ATP-dependent DNA helicase PcrA [Calditerrivibrio nitroreducens DSM 19672]